MTTKLTIRQTSPRHHMTTRRTRPAHLALHAIIGGIVSLLLAQLMFSLLPVSAYVGGLGIMLIATIMIPSQPRLILLLYYVTWVLVFAIGILAAQMGNRESLEFLFDWA